MHFLSNLITIISNANAAKLNSVSCKISTRNELNYIFQILTILQKEGIIRGFSYIKKRRSNKKATHIIIIYLNHIQIILIKI